MNIRAKLAFTPFVLFFGSVMAAPGLATAPTPPPASVPGNSCDSRYQYVKESTVRMNYAVTGKIAPGWTPKYSRAWYMAILGMTSELTAYLKQHPEHDPDILVAAVSTGRSQIVANLLALGFDPNQPSGAPDYAPPLQAAASCQRAESMIYLLAAGADPYGTTRYDGPALGYAIVGNGFPASRPFEKGVALLLAAGVDPRCPISKAGITPVHAARNLTEMRPDSEAYRQLLVMLENAVRIAEVRNPGNPKCGVLSVRPR